jgi:peptidoglycan-N-acetylglucosamine deacetylase
MDADPEGYFNSSMLFKATILTISFTSFYFYKSGKKLSFLKPTFVENALVKAKLENKPAAKKKKKTIYLTFDDGPCKGTKTVMTILKQEQVPATLFIIGEHVYGSKSQLAIYDSLKACTLFEVANHSYTHAFENKFYKFYSQPDSATNDFKRCADSLHFTNNIIRTPGRNIWRTPGISSTDLKAAGAAGDSLYSKGYKAIGWDVEWNFNAAQRLVQTDTEMLQIIDSVFAHKETKTNNHLVVLAHDRTFLHAADSIKLQHFIAALKKKDEYDFEMVSKYPEQIKDTAIKK